MFGTYVKWDHALIWSLVMPRWYEINAPSTAHGARSAAATELRRSRSGQLSARRVRDGADAAATELMLRAALLRRSCDGAATESLLRRSCADQHQLLILRVASRRDALNEELA